MDTTDSRLPSLGPRGEGWVVLQAILLAAEGAAGLAGPAWQGPARLATSLAGAVAIGAGGALALRAARGLGSQLTPLPRPGDSADLVQSGAFGLVRHPIYGGIVIGATGWGLVTASPAAMAGAFILLAFFDLKSRREEAWLVKRFPEYAAYQRRTRRLIPWLY